VAIHQFRHVAMHSKGKEAGTVEAMQDAELGLAKARCFVQYSIEHRANLAGLGADHAQHLGRRGLLFQRPAEFHGARLHFLKQARILEGNYGLVSEGFDQFDLFIGEGLDFCALKDDGTQRTTVTNQRHTQTGATIVALRRTHEGELRVSLEVVHMDGATLERNATGYGSTIDGNQGNTLVVQSYRWRVDVAARGW